MDMTRNNYFNKSTFGTSSTDQGQITNIPESSFHTYKTDYVTGAHASVFFGPVLVDEIVQISYKTISGKQPSYGWNDKYIARVVDGNYIIQGSFAVYRRTTNYMQNVLTEIEKRMSASQTGQKQATLLDLVDRQISQYAARFVDVNNEATKQKMIKYLHTISNRHIEIELQQQSPFNIYIVFGNYLKENFTVDTISDIVLTSTGTTLTIDSSINVEMYDFYSRGKIIPYDPPAIARAPKVKSDEDFMADFENTIRNIAKAIDIYPNLETYIELSSVGSGYITDSRVGFTGIPSERQLLIGRFVDYTELSFITSYDKFVTNKKPAILHAYKEHLFYDPIDIANLANYGVLYVDPDDNTQYMVAIAPIQVYGNETFADMNIPTTVDIDTFAYSQNKVNSFTKALGYASVVHKHIKFLTRSNDAGKITDGNNYVGKDALTKSRMNYLTITEREFNPESYQGVDYDVDDIGGVNTITGALKEEIALPDNWSYMQGIDVGAKVAHFGTTMKIEPKVKEYSKTYKDKLKDRTIVFGQRIWYGLHSSYNSEQGKLKTTGDVGILDTSTNGFAVSEISGVLSQVPTNALVSVRLVAFPAVPATLRYDLSDTEEAHQAFLMYLSHQDKFSINKTTCPEDQSKITIEKDMIANGWLDYISESRLSDVALALDGSYYSGNLTLKYKLKSLVTPKVISDFGPTTKSSDDYHSKLNDNGIQNNMQALARYCRLEFMKYLSWCRSWKSPNDRITNGYNKKWNSLEEIPNNYSVYENDNIERISEEFLDQYVDNITQTKYPFDERILDADDDRYEKVLIDMFAVVDIIEGFNMETSDENNNYYLDYSDTQRDEGTTAIVPRDDLAIGNNTNITPTPGQKRDFIANVNLSPYSRNYFYVLRSPVNWTDNNPVKKRIDPSIVTYISGFKTKFNPNSLAAMLESLLNNAENNTIRKRLARLLKTAYPVLEPVTGRQLPSTISDQAIIRNKIKNILVDELITNKKRKNVAITAKENGAWYEIDGKTIYPSPFKVKGILQEMDQSVEDVPGFEIEES